MFADVGGVLVTHSGTVYTEAVTVSAGARHTEVLNNRAGGTAGWSAAVRTLQ